MKRKLNRTTVILSIALLAIVIFLSRILSRPSWELLSIIGVFIAIMFVIIMFTVTVEYQRIRLNRIVRVIKKEIVPALKEKGILKGVNYFNDKNRELDIEILLSNKDQIRLKYRIVDDYFEDTSSEIEAQEEVYIRANSKLKPKTIKDPSIKNVREITTSGRYFIFNIYDIKSLQAEEIEQMKVYAEKHS